MWNELKEWIIKQDALVKKGWSCPPWEVLDKMNELEKCSCGLRQKILDRIKMIEEIPDNDPCWESEIAGLKELLDDTIPE